MGVVREEDRFVQFRPSLRGQVDVGVTCAPRNDNEKTCLKQDSHVE